MDYFRPLFPHIPLKRSLYRLVERKGKGFLTKSYIGNVWLPNEKERWPAKRGGGPGTWLDSNNDTPQEPAKSEEQVRQEWEELKAKAKLGSDGFMATGLESTEDEEERHAMLEAQRQQIHNKESI